MVYLNFCQFLKLFSIFFYLLKCNADATQDVQFFEKDNFEGYMHAEMTTSRCTNLPTWFANANGSVRAPGCLMLFKDRDCHHTGFKIDQEETQLSSLEYRYSPLKNFDYHVNSFRNCTFMETRPQVDLDIYDEPNQKGEIIARFRDICKCKNLPKFTIGKTVSANTFGNCIKVFEDENCQGNYAHELKDQNIKNEKGNLFLTASVLDFIRSSVFVSETSTPEQPISILPCQIPAHCFRLKATIVNFEPLTNISNIPRSIKEVAITAKQTFRNNGTATLEENYDFTKQIRETSKLEFSKAFKQNISLQFNASIATTIPFIDGVLPKLQANLLAGFQSVSDQNETKVHVVESIREFRIQKRISVPPCTEYEVTSFVEMAENVKIDFLVQFKVTGEIGIGSEAERMTVDEIRNHLTNLTYVGTADNHTVKAETRVKLITNFGINSVFNGAGIPIIDCLMRHTQCSCAR